MPLKDTPFVNLLIAQQEACFYCDRKISFDKGLKATRDHFYPMSEGGVKGLSNVVLACKECNHRKGAKMPCLIELVKWNKLAAIWPHIKPIDLEPIVPHKACRRCGQEIPLDRLLITRRALLETQTCSKECSRKEHNRHTKLRHKQVKADKAKRRSVHEQVEYGRHEDFNPEPPRQDGVQVALH